MIEDFLMYLVILESYIFQLELTTYFVLLVIVFWFFTSNHYPIILGLGFSLLT
jgi:hypothetical protein